MKLFGNIVLNDGSCAFPHEFALKVVLPGGFTKFEWNGRVYVTDKRGVIEYTGELVDELMMLAAA